MARKKVNLQYIPNNSTRRDTFKRRTRGLMKKANELAILCDAKPCVVIYGEGEAVPQVFPSHAEAATIINQFKNMSELKKHTKMDHELFLLQRIHKLQGQVHKSERNCKEHEIRSLLQKAMLGNLPNLTGLSSEDINNAGSEVEVILKRIGNRITKIRDQQLVYQPSPVQAPTPNVTRINTIEPAMIYMDQVPSHYQESWLEKLKSGGGDLGALVYSGFNGGCDGATSSDGFGGVQLFDLGDGSIFP
jgi:hypothetical protein